MLTINTRTADYIWFVGQELPNISDKDVVTLSADENELGYLMNNISVDFTVQQTYYGNKYLLVVDRKARQVFQALMDCE